MVRTSLATVTPPSPSVSSSPVLLSANRTRGFRGAVRVHFHRSPTRPSPHAMSQHGPVHTTATLTGECASLDRTVPASFAVTTASFVASNRLCKAPKLVVLLAEPGAPSLPPPPPPPSPPSPPSPAFHPGGMGVPSTTAPMQATYAHAHQPYSTAQRTTGAHAVT